MMKYIMVRRHALTTNRNGKEVLSESGIRLAHEVGREICGCSFTHVFYSHVQRTVQTALAYAEGAGDFPDDRYQTLEALCTKERSGWAEYLRTHAKLDLAHPFVAAEVERITRQFDHEIRRLEDGAHVLAVGHSNLLECLVYGLTGHVLAPLNECEGATLVNERSTYRFMSECRCGNRA
jgi:broad specificity phosphatase PhoE